MNLMFGYSEWARGSNTSSWPEGRFESTGGSVSFHCNQSTCKAEVSQLRGTWPVRCPECHTALYPRDVLDGIPYNELEPNRGILMRKNTFGLVEAISSEIPGGGKSLLDEMLDEVEGATSAPQPSRRRIRFAIAAAPVFGLAILCAVASRAWHAKSGETVDHASGLDPDGLFIAGAGESRARSLPAP